MAIFYTDTASIELLTVTNLTAQTSSILYITQSQLNVENNLITVNTNTPQVRFGGFAVIDSGSSDLSGSLLFDSQNNQWIYVHQSAPGADVTSSVLIMGPQTFNNVGGETTITTNRLTKGSSGDLGEHITSSNVTDTGTLVSINSDTEVTGSLKVTTSISASSLTGSLFGTASWAQSASQALTASFLPIGTYQITASWAQSASQALTASFLPISTYAITASWANSASQALTASFLPTGTYNITSSWAQSASQAVSSSYALSASYAPGGGGVTINNNTDNYILTATGTANTVNGESNLTFNGSSLVVTGNISASAGITGSLLGTASFTTTASFAITASALSYTSATQVFATATTTINAATYIDITGCSVSLAPGTWLITGFVVGAATNAIVQGFLSIRDGSNNVIAAAAMTRPASATANLNSPMSVSWSAIVSPTTTTTYKLSAARGLTTHTATWTVYDGTGYNTTNHANDANDKGTNILAIRLA